MQAIFPFCLLGFSSYTGLGSEYGVLAGIPHQGMTRADLAYFKSTAHPRAVLVLCPGYNGDGSAMIQQKSWRDFAERENLGMVGIHFESPINLLERCEGYYQASRGSGEVLTEGIRKIFGEKLPILIFGFSGGAHFTTRFVAWNPAQIMGWCALGAGVLDRPIGTSSNPPGIMACGEDDPRLSGALIFFKQGRAVGKPWLWIQVPKTGHATSSALDYFVRCYFSILLNRPLGSGAWVDIDLLKQVPEEEALQNPSLTGWLPDPSLFDQWQEINRK